MPIAPQLQKPQDKPPSSPARLLIPVFLQQINLPPLPSSLYPHHLLTGQRRRLGRAMAGLTQACSVHKLLQIERFCQSLRPQGNRFLLPNLIITRGQSNSRGKSHVARWVPALCTHTLPFSLARGPAEGKAGETRGEEEAGEERGSMRSPSLKLCGRRDWRVGRLLRPSPGAIPLPPSAWHMPEHRSNKDSLGTGAGQVFSQASGSCSLSNSYTCSSWTRLSSANSPRAGKEKRKQR